MAAQLDIPYYVLDYTDEFRDGVVNRFVRDYGSGRTPNPCIECNRTVKFDRLLNGLADFDSEVLVTGHHARNRHIDGSWRLHRGEDRAKDQSYVLSMLTQAELSRIRLPVGELTKTEVRSIAAEMGLRTADKPESMDICFVGQRDYRGFLRDAAPEVFEPGPLVASDGTELGSHDGIVGFTVGQRVASESRWESRGSSSESTLDPRQSCSAVATSWRLPVWASASSPGPKEHPSRAR